MEKATIYDYIRMCKSFEQDCRDCPLFTPNDGRSCRQVMEDTPDKANEIILKWCKEHPAKKRQDRFLKLYPNSLIDGDNVSHICPRYINKQFICQEPEKRCCDCRKEYWLAEVDEHDK